MNKVKNPYRYKRPAIDKALGVSRWTLIRWEKRGKFTPPRTMGNTRIFTKEQIKEIKKAFSRGGVGEWHFKNEPS